MLLVMVNRISAAHGFLLILCWVSIHCQNNCQLTNITMAVEKEECGYCGNVNVSWCSGYCFTKDPVFKERMASIYQYICSYKEVIYQTITIPNCPSNVSPYYTYPVAISCQCGMCNTETTDCTVSALEPKYCSFTQQRKKRSLIMHSTLLHRNI
ncbi:follitropin subunit beta precursor [Callorhinchus milii]|uniref:Follitropin subunit beta n=1 Tax=Callorhinchus milii TaxID=7868 RepID=F1BZV9_CALMI|nr:follitropin subunit beta precursor [Callorhinchus milii]ADX01333.1 follicle stimulating hormone beta subunit [Callorhinchus milii]|eukprot:gi/632941437/ref/XP_007885864.1/ PREDICTED: follitropin subunit beta [Callorhinchus milii]